MWTCRGLHAQTWQKVISLLSAGVWVAAGWYTGSILWSHFAAGRFGFHDLTVINDWLSNAVYRGQPFYITDYKWNHFSYHVAPSLLVLAPLWRIFDSQFLLLALGLLCLYSALGYLWFTVRLALQRIAIRDPIATLLATAVCLFFAFQLFTKTVLMAAHFTIFFTSVSVLLLCLLLNGVHLRWVLACTVLLLGVRQDAGFFLTAQLLALVCLPKQVFKTAKGQVIKRCLVLSVIAVVYTVAVVTVLMPLIGVYGRPGGWAYWQRWGQTWPEIFLSFVSSPVAVWEAIANSGALALNQSFLWIQWLNPLAGLFVNAPGILFYTAADESRNGLWWYNAGLLLPGFWLAFVGGLLQLYTLITRLFRDQVQRVLLCLPPLLLACSLLHAFWTLAEIHPSGTHFQIVSGEVQKTFSSFFTTQIRACPQMTAVATDFHHIVFIPHRYERFLLHNFRDAELVLVWDNSSSVGLGHTTVEELLGAIQADAQFTRVPSGLDTWHVFRRKTLHCS